MVRGTIVKAPCKNYHGFALAEVIGTCTDTRGQTMVTVRALYSEPWFDNGMWGAAPTRWAKFYPEVLKEIGASDE